MSVCPASRDRGLPEILGIPLGAMAGNGDHLAISAARISQGKVRARTLMHKLLGQQILTQLLLSLHYILGASERLPPKPCTIYGA